MHDFGVFINITKAIFVKLTQKIHQIHTVSNQLGYKAKLQQRQMACFCYNNTNKSNDPIEKEIRKKGLNIRRRFNMSNKGTSEVEKRMETGSGT